MVDINSMEIIECPTCKGKGQIIRRYGYCPDVYTEDEQLEILMAARGKDDIPADKFKVIKRDDADWTIVCPLCRGSKEIVVTTPNNLTVEELMLILSKEEPAGN